jgi:hypothetical protein
VIEECRSIVARPSTLDAAGTITLIRSAPQALGGALIDRRRRSRGRILAAPRGGLLKGT